MHLQTDSLSPTANAWEDGLLMDVITSYCLDRSSDQTNVVLAWCRQWNWIVCACVQRGFTRLPRHKAEKSQLELSKYVMVQDRQLKIHKWVSNRDFHCFNCRTKYTRAACTCPDLINFRVYNLPGNVNLMKLLTDTSHKDTLFTAGARCRMYDWYILHHYMQT